MTPGTNQGREQIPTNFDGVTSPKTKENSFFHTLSDVGRNLIILQLEPLVENWLKPRVFILFYLLIYLNGFVNQSENVKWENMRKWGGQARDWAIYRQPSGSLKRHKPIRECHVSNPLEEWSDVTHQPLTDSHVAACTPSNISISHDA